MQKAVLYTTYSQYGELQKALSSENDGARGLLILLLGLPSTDNDGSSMVLEGILRPALTEAAAAAAGKALLDGLTKALVTLQLQI